MAYMKKLLRDLWGIPRVCGFPVAFKWGLGGLLRLPSILRQRNLSPADRAMGAGPFKVRMRNYGLGFRIKGSGAFSGIREMYVRDTYLHNGTLTIRDGDSVVDLGANMGNFSNLALAHGDAVRVVAVEPSKAMNAAFKESLGLNDGHLERARLVNAFIGLMADMQQQMKLTADYADAQYLSEDELIDLAGITRVDFLKCDIEGGEFGLLHPDSKLLRMARSLAVEIHHFAGDVDGFLQMLKDCGFDILAIQRDPDGTATALARRRD